MNEFIKCFKNYSVFEGRARRREYWMFYLFNIIFLIAAMILDSVLGLKVGSYGYGILYILYTLAVLIPGIAVSVRRLHDVNKSGWMMFISFIPLIGAIWLFILMVRDGTVGGNQYGPDPKGSMIDNSNIYNAPIVPISNIDNNPISDVKIIKPTGMNSPVDENSSKPIV